MTKILVSLRKERFSHWHIDDCWLQGPVGVDDVDELCRFWAASNCGEDDVCYVTMMAMLMVMVIVNHYS